MAFTRKFLMDHGVPEDQVDAILAERNRTLSDYIPKGDVQKQIEEAVDKARKEAADKPVNVQETEEYKALAGELAKTKAFTSEAFASVKPKFRDSVWSLLDHDKPMEEQMPKIAEQYEEYFSIPSDDPKPEPEKPHFGSPDKGGMPRGKSGKDLFDMWGFGK